MQRYFNFASGHNDTDDNAVPPNSATSRRDSLSHPRDEKSSSLLHAKSVSDRTVADHIWDSSEQHFLVVFTKPSLTSLMEEADPLRPRDALRSRDNSVVSLFVHEDLGVVVHDARTAEADVLRLVGVEIPFIVFLKNEDSDEGPSINIARTVMSDFVGKD